MAEIKVPSGSSLQAALDRANPGDVLLLQAGAPYVGNFRLRDRGATATSPITITTEGFDIPAGQRVTPADDAKMARILTPGNGAPVLEVDAGAGHYKLIGLYISAGYGTDPSRQYGSSFLITIASGNDSNPGYGRWLGHDITFDRVHVAGKFNDSRFAFAIAGERVSVINSHIDEFAGGRGTDSGGFLFTNAGGHLIENNLVSAGMWMIDMGGADSDSPNRAKVVSGSATSATLTNFEGVRPAVGDLVAFFVWARPDQMSTWKPSLEKWEANTSYPQGATLWAGADFLGRTRFFYVEQAGTSGATTPDWNSTDEYQKPRLTDGTVRWRYFNGQWMVGKVTGVSGDTITYAAEGPTGIAIPPIAGTTARWNGYNPSVIVRLTVLRSHYPLPVLFLRLVGTVVAGEAHG